jgi:hypothetical protein
MKKNIEDRKYGDIVSFKSCVNPVFHTKLYLKGSAFLSGKRDLKRMLKTVFSSNKLINELFQ